MYVHLQNIGLLKSWQKLQASVLNTIRVVFITVIVVLNQQVGNIARYVKIHNKLSLVQNSTIYIIV